MNKKPTKLNKLTIELKNTLLKSNFPHPLFKRGKVRDIYDLGNELLIVSTDRISAFDVVLPDGIPHQPCSWKGRSGTSGDPRRDRRPSR